MAVGAIFGTTQRDRDTAQRDATPRAAEPEKQGEPDSTGEAAQGGKERQRLRQRGASTAAKKFAAELATRQQRERGREGGRERVTATDVVLSLVERILTVGTAVCDWIAIFLSLMLIISLVQLYLARQHGIFFDWVPFK